MAARQHYNLACGGALAQVDGAKKVLKLAKGGRVGASSYVGLSNASGKKVGTTDRIGNKPVKRPAFSEGQFKKGVNVSGKKGDDKFTTVTQKSAHLAKGFKVQRP